MLGVVFAASVADVTGEENKFVDVDLNVFVEVTAGVEGVTLPNVYEPDVGEENALLAETVAVDDIDSTVLFAGWAPNENFVKGEPKGNLL